MPSRLIETWQAREKVREEPPTDEMLVALLEILLAFREILSYRDEQFLFLLFKGEGPLQFEPPRYEVHRAEVVSFFLKKNVALPSLTTARSLSLEVNVGMLPHQGARVAHSKIKFTPNDQGGFDIETDFDSDDPIYTVRLNSQYLIHAITILKDLIQKDPNQNYRRNHALRRALEQFDQAVYRLDHEGDAELIGELVQLVRLFSGKIQGLIGQVDSLERTGRAELKRQASAAQKEMDRVVREAADWVTAASLEKRRTVAANNRATAAETKAARAEVRAKAAEAKAAKAEALQKQALTQYRDAAEARDRFSKKQDDALTELVKAQDALAKYKRRASRRKVRAEGATSVGNAFKNGFINFTEWLSENIHAAIDLAWEFKIPLGLLGSLVGGIHMCNRQHLNEGTEQREAVRFLVNDGDETNERWVSVHYQAPFSLSQGAYLYHGADHPDGYNASMPLTEADIQPGGAFYYGGLAMEFLEGSFSLSAQGCGAIRDTRYHTIPWILPRIMDGICGFSAPHNGILLNANHRRVGPGAYGINNLAWVYWRFKKGVHDERMTIGHQLVSAASLRYPWVSDQDELVQVEDGDVTRIVDRVELSSLQYRGEVTCSQNFCPSILRGPSSDPSKHWVDPQSNRRISWAHQSWDSRSQYNWENIKERATEALDGLIAEGKLLNDGNPVFSLGEGREAILNEISDAHPQSWQTLNENSSVTIPYSNPGKAFPSIFDSPVEEAIRELGHYEFKDSWTSPYTYGDLRDEVASVTLTIDPDMQAKLMELVEKGIYQDENFFEEGVRVMVLNDEGEIVAFFDDSPLHEVEPSSRHWAPFNYAADNWRNWFFEFSPSGYNLSDCYSSGHALQDWFAMLTDIRKAHPVARPHIVKSYTLRNGKEMDISPVYSENQAACARDLANGGRGFKNFETELKALDYRRSFSIDGVGEIPYFRLPVSLDTTSSDEMVTAWTRFKDDDPYRPDPYYTVILSDAGNKYSYYATGRVLKGIYQVWHDRNVTPSN